MPRRQSVGGYAKGSVGGMTERRRTPEITSINPDKGSWPFTGARRIGAY